MKNIYLFIATSLLALNTQAANVIENSDAVLQLKEVELTVATTTEKLFQQSEKCVPNQKAFIDAADYVRKNKNAVKITDILFLNNTEAESCPEQFDLKVLVRYIAK